ncbi:hypothetical protein KA478_04310, partial [Patescibacteria group bacterium]|nr:hypothetical protein [Patescibacteria group bacterium]
WFGLKLIRRWTPEIDTQLRIAQDAGNNESGVIQFLFDGMTYEDAVAKFKEEEEIKKAAKIAAEEKEQKRRERRIKRKNAWRQFSTKNKWRLLLPFTLIIYIFKGIWWLIRKIFWEVPITLRNLWVLFYRDACPYITKQKQI